jgi:site-specific DNA-cytosine methylase
MVESKKKRRRCGRNGAQGSRSSQDDTHDDLMPLPNPMVGFNLPSDRIPPTNRRFPVDAAGPPYFYYEDMAVAPKEVWDRNSIFLYNVVPEFVDSKYMCAAARERGYMHNLPIHNRSALLPLPKKTIFRVLPHSKPWWPSWDKRTQLDCLQTHMPSHIHVVLSCHDDIPPPWVQEYVMDECRKWNLVWIGKNRVAPLKPHEMEYVHGFPRDHTRGATETERCIFLANSFQVDTVAYHLSMLKDMFPDGMNVLSLFTGIGGAEVALHKLGIHMKMVVSVEISQASRYTFRSWWDKTQSGTLVQINDVCSLTYDKIKALIRKHGDFDLLTGGAASIDPGNRPKFDLEQASLFSAVP